uniref:ADP-ribosylation factor-related protein 1 n=1 Tax=Caenorhabditis tropicalis TaxID=1561998 RepID=A0A1I7TQM6_9PELO
MDLNDPTTLAVLVAAVVGLATILFLVLKNLRSSNKNRVLLVGVMDSGKTTIFTQLSQKEAEYPTTTKTFTSMVENRITLRIKDKERKIIDYPGNDRLRQKLIDLIRSRSLLRIVFVVDSAAFSKNARDVAELFYLVAFENTDKVPILIACHKQDLSLAKTEKVIRNSLEKEIGLINKSRAAALIGTDGSEEKRATLTETGVDFRWEDLKKQEVTFVTTSSYSEDFGIYEIASFVKS